MPPSSQTKDIADFFRPYSRHLTSSSVPRKRPASSAPDEDAVGLNTRSSSVQKTPAKSVSFKDVTPSSFRSARLPDVADAALPIRSPNTIRVSKSPRRALSDPPSPSKTSPTLSSAVDTRPNVSFTFSNTSERSNNVIKDGVLVAVRDSDEDSDDSLESIGDIFKSRKRNDGNGDDVCSDRGSDSDDVEAERVRTLSMFTHGRSVPIVGKDKLRALQLKDRSIKFDLSKVLKDHYGAEEADERIRRARQGSVDEDARGGAADLDGEVLASVIRRTDHETDENEVSRLLHAVERTDALEGKKVFSFFEPATNSEDVMAEKFPDEDIPQQLWDPGDSQGRARAYLSGYMADLAARGKLADEVLTWTFHQIRREQQDYLRQSYVRTLQVGSKIWTRVNLTATDVQTVFRDLGAQQVVARENTLIEARYQTTQQGSVQDFRFLLSTIHLFTKICQDMDMLALSKLTSLILRLSLDSTTMSNINLSLAIETLLTTIVDIPTTDVSSHIYNHITSDMSQHLLDPKLQAILLSHISPTSPQTTRLRKQLADTFLLNPTTTKSTSATSPATFDTLATHISTSPTFSLTRHHNHPPPDYTQLTSRIAIIDMAIGSGTFFSSLSSTSPSTPSHKSEITTFNASLDRLAARTHALFTSIKDTGASHMRRTEAKDALQALYFRLLYGVRIGVRKKRQVFELERAGGGKATRVARTEDEVDEQERGGEFMRRFLKKNHS